MEPDAGEFSLEIEAGGVIRSVRFPLHLPARLLAGDKEWVATTENISASGVLFRLEESLPLDVRVEFLLEIPAEQFCGETTAAVHCLGHVVRSYREHAECFAAAVIDEYRFQ